MSGMVGKMFMEFGLTVVFVMIISILDALTIAPMLSAYIINDHDKGKKISPAQQKAISFIHKLTLDWFSKLYSVVDNFYIAAVRLVLRHKLKTILITAVVFTAALLIAFRLKVNFMPNLNLGQFYISIQAEAGADLDATDKYASEVEAILLNDPNVDFSFTTVGNSKAQYNQASIYVRMVDKPTMTTEDFQNLIRSKMAGKLGNASMSFATSVGLSGGQSQVMYNLVGDTQSKLAEVESVLIEKFRQIPSFVDLNTNYMQGNPEFQINFNFEQMNKLGINSVTAGNELRSMVAGNIAAQYRENGFEYNILVQLPDSQKDLPNEFDSIYVENINGSLIKLSHVATSTYAVGPTQINKKDRDIYVSLEGNIAKNGSQGQIQKAVFEIFNEEKAKPEHKDWENISLLDGNDERSVSSMGTNVAIAALFSIILLFLILTSLYESLIMPLVIMSALPLAVIGGFLALFMTGKALDLFTLIGMVMLMGIVAKNSILLVDYIQQKIKTGLSLDEAIVAACKTRLRPILMTTSAIIAGMLPTALGLSEMGAFRQGLGIVVIGGVVSSTALTLLVIPAIFEYVDNFRIKIRKKLGRPANRMVDNTPEELEKKGL
jgi:multidrug efflux pump subunit AcrB